MRSCSRSLARSIISGAPVDQHGVVLDVLGPEPARQESGQAAAPQAAEAPVPSPLRLSCRSRSTAWPRRRSCRGRAPPAAGSQLGGNLHQDEGDEMVDEASETGPTGRNVAHDQYQQPLPGRRPHHHSITARRALARRCVHDVAVHDLQPQPNGGGELVQPRKVLRGGNRPCPRRKSST